MKTITDLLNLIANVTESNNCKMVEYLIQVDLRYKWCSAVESIVSYNSEDPTIRPLFTCESIGTPERLQLVYWTIVCKCRNNMKHD